MNAQVLNLYSSENYLALFIRDDRADLQSICTHPSFPPLSKQLYCMPKSSFFTFYEATEQRIHMKMGKLSMVHDTFDSMAQEEMGTKVNLLRKYSLLTTLVSD